ncbi:MAG: molybdopterin-dependent oxidoreductase [Nitrospirota bacterium]|jgi:anaerobic selenocysteine-containing dehydrogenase
MELTRRQLFKYSALGGALLGMERSFDHIARAMELLEGGKEVSRTTGKNLKAIPSTCLHCYARCGNFGFTAYGELLKIGPSTHHPNSRGRLCAKGQAGLNRVYDPDRLLVPLKRTGPRGEGKWRQISWEAAYQEIADRLQALRDAGTPERFVFQSDRDITTQEITLRFCHALGSPNALVNHPVGGLNKSVAQQLTWGADFEVPDVANSQYILIFGSNPYEAHYLRTSFVQRIAEARGVRRAGTLLKPKAKMVVFDVRVTQTSGRADEWHPIQPGTDGAVALAMAHVIVEEGLYDADFMENWTNYPLRSLRSHLRQYTPEWAEGISGVKASDIKRLAREFATTKPATTVSTGGVTKHANGVYTERAVALLNALTGNVDVEGGYCLPRSFQLAEPQPVPPVPNVASELLHPSDYPLARHEVPSRVLPAIKEGKAKVGVYMTYQYNPVYSQSEGSSLAKILGDEELIPYFVCLDSVYSETAAYADLVLPTATFAERWELESPPAFEMVPFVSLRQPLILPLGEAVAVTDVLINLAARLGDDVHRYFDFTTRQYLEEQLKGVPGIGKVGGLHYLMDKGFWFDAAASPEYRSYQRRGFATPSGKFEIYSARMEQAGFSPLPIFQQLPVLENLEEEEFTLVTYQSRVHTHDRTANCMWLSEIDHDNPAFLNGATLERLGIADGSEVVLASRVGRVRTKVKAIQGIHPKVIAVSDNMGHWEFGRVAQAVRFESDVKTTKLLWWEEHGVHPMPIIALKQDPIGGGEALMDTKVWLSRA